MDAGDFADGECPQWIRDFQYTYLKQGIKDTDAQRVYMATLAKHYEEEFDKTNHWRNALKVCAFGMECTGTMYMWQKFMEGLLPPLLFTDLSYNNS